MSADEKTPLDPETGEWTPCAWEAWKARALRAEKRETALRVAIEQLAPPQETLSEMLKPTERRLGTLRSLETAEVRRRRYSNGARSILTMLANDAAVAELNDDELSRAVIDGPWADLPMASRASSLVSELVARFRRLAKLPEDL